MELAKRMELIEIIFNYKGTLIEAEIRPEKDCFGAFYLVELNGNYAYTLHCADNGKWVAIDQKDQSMPMIEGSFLQMLTNQLDWELKKSLA